MEKRKLLIATRNNNKFSEIVYILSDLNFEFVNLNDLPIFPPDYEVEEPAFTFEGNAIIKAMTIGSKAECLTLADDSGLAVDTLDGRPGVQSARYTTGNDEDRYNKLLEEMKGIKEEDRTAYFVSVVAIYSPEDGKIRTCVGKYKGYIAFQPKGRGGFGYDPVFFYPPLNKTSAEMTMEEKNSISHRSQSLEKAKEILIKEFIS